MRASARLSWSVPPCVWGSWIPSSTSRTRSAFCVSWFHGAPGNSSEMTSSIATCAAMLGSFSVRALGMYQYVVARRYSASASRRTASSGNRRGRAIAREYTGRATRRGRRRAGARPRAALGCGRAHARTRAPVPRGRGAPPAGRGGARGHPRSAQRRRRLPHLRRARLPARAPRVRPGGAVRPAHHGQAQLLGHEQVARFRDVRLRRRLPRQPAPRRLRNHRRGGRRRGRKPLRGRPHGAAPGRHAGQRAARALGGGAGARRPPPHQSP